MAATAPEAVPVGPTQLEAQAKPLSPHRLKHLQREGNKNMQRAERNQKREQKREIRAQKRAERQANSLKNNADYQEAAYESGKYFERKQQERNFFVKIGASMIEGPVNKFRTQRLYEVRRQYREKYGQDPVMTSSFVQEAIKAKGKLSGLSENTSREVQAASKVKSQLQELAKGEMYSGANDLIDRIVRSDANSQSFVEGASKVLKELVASDVSPEIVQRKIQELVQQHNQSVNATEFTEGLVILAREMKLSGVRMEGKLAEAAFNHLLTENLSSQQQEQLQRLVSISNKRAGIFAALYGKNAALAGLGYAGVTFFGTNPLGIALVTGTGLLMSGYSRYQQIKYQGTMRALDVARGISHGEKQYRGIARIFSVDYDADPKTQKIQTLRAIAVGSISGLAFSHIHDVPQAIEAVHNALSSHLSAPNIDSNPYDTIHSLAQGHVTAANEASVIAGNNGNGQTIQELTKLGADLYKGNISQVGKDVSASLNDFMSPNSNNHGAPIYHNPTEPTVTHEVPPDQATSHQDIPMEHTPEHSNNFTHVTINKDLHSSVPANGNEAFGMNDQIVKVGGHYALKLNPYDAGGGKANCIYETVNGHTIELPLTHGQNILDPDSSKTVTIYVDGVKEQVPMSEACKIFGIQNSNLSYAYNNLGIHDSTDFFHYKGELGGFRFGTDPNQFGTDSGHNTIIDLGQVRGTADQSHSGFTSYMNTVQQSKATDTGLQPGGGGTEEYQTPVGQFVDQYIGADWLASAADQATLFAEQHPGLAITYAVLSIEGGLTSHRGLNSRWGHFGGANRGQNIAHIIAVPVITTTLALTNPGAAVMFAVAYVAPYVPVFIRGGIQRVFGRGGNPPQQANNGNAQQQPNQQGGQQGQPNQGGQQGQVPQGGQPVQNPNQGGQTPPPQQPNQPGGQVPPLPVNANPPGVPQQAIQAVAPQFIPNPNNQGGPPIIAPITPQNAANAAQQINNTNAQQNQPNQPNQQLTPQAVQNAMGIVDAITRAPNGTFHVQDAAQQIAEGLYRQPSLDPQDRNNAELLAARLTNNPAEIPLVADAIQRAAFAQQAVGNLLNTNPTQQQYEAAVGGAIGAMNNGLDNDIRNNLHANNQDNEAGIALLQAIALRNAFMRRADIPAVTPQQQQERQRILNQNNLAEQAIHGAYRNQPPEIRAVVAVAANARHRRLSRQQMGLIGVRRQLMEDALSAATITPSSLPAEILPVIQELERQYGPNIPYLGTPAELRTNLLQIMNDPAHRYPLGTRAEVMMELAGPDVHDQIRAAAQQVEIAVNGNPPVRTVNRADLYDVVKIIKGRGLQGITPDEISTDLQDFFTRARAPLSLRETATMMALLSRENTPTGQLGEGLQELFAGTLTQQVLREAIGDMVAQFAHQIDPDELRNTLFNIPAFANLDFGVRQAIAGHMLTPDSLVPLVPPLTAEKAYALALAAFEKVRSNDPFNNTQGDANNIDNVLDIGRTIVIIPQLIQLPIQEKAKVFRDALGISDQQGRELAQNTIQPNLSLQDIMPDAFFFGYPESPSLQSVNEFAQSLLTAQNNLPQRRDVASIDSLINAFDSSIPLDSRAVLLGKLVDTPQNTSVVVTMGHLLHANSGIDDFVKVAAGLNTAGINSQEIRNAFHGRQLPSGYTQRERVTVDAWTEAQGQGLQGEEAIRVAILVGGDLDTAPQEFMNNALALLNAGVPVNDLRATVNGFGPNIPSANREPIIGQVISLVTGGNGRSINVSNIGNLVQNALAIAGYPTRLSQQDAFALTAYVDTLLSGQPYSITDPTIIAAAQRAIS